MQGHTYKEEKELEIIWSPQIDVSGKVPHSWLRMKEVKRYDRIFHYVKGFIVAISTVKEDCKEGSKPLSIQNQNKWNDEGYLVNLEYHELDVPLNVKAHLKEILPLLPVKYSAFQSNGDGNQGYLYPCNEQLSLKLLECISIQNVYAPEDEQLEFSIDEIKRTERTPLATFIAETESEAMMKIRRGQQQFRKRLMPVWHNKCPLCGIGLDVVLRASHSKPWKDSTDQERLDPFNGVLLCCNHDALYDKGLITFDGKGRLYISNEIAREDYLIYGLDEGIQISTVPENKPFFMWHKRNVFVD